MAIYPIKMLRDEENNPFIPFVSEYQLGMPHSATLERDAIDSHPIEAITGLKSKLVNINARLEGAMISYTFATEEEMWNRINNDPDWVSQLEVGNNLYIIDTSSPDYWWDGTAPQILENGDVNLTDYYRKFEVDQKDTNVLTTATNLTNSLNNAMNERVTVVEDKTQYMAAVSGVTQITGVLSVKSDITEGSVSYYKIQNWMDVNTQEVGWVGSHKGIGNLVFGGGNNRGFEWHPRQFGTTTGSMLLDENGRLTVNGLADVNSLKVATTASIVGTLDVTGTTTLNERLNNKKGSWAHTTKGEGGVPGYLNVATITITGTYANSPIEFTIKQRSGMSSVLRVLFNSVTPAANHAISSLTYTGSVMGAWLLPLGAGVFELYVQKVEGWDDLTVTSVDMSQYQSSRVNIVWNSHQVAAVPAGAVMFARESPTYAGLLTTGGIVSQATVHASDWIRSFNGAGYATYEGADINSVWRVAINNTGGYGVIAGNSNVLAFRPLGVSSNTNEVYLDTNGSLVSRGVSSTYINGSKGVGSTLVHAGPAASYKTIMSAASTNGRFSLTAYQDKVILGYQTQASINAGTNNLNRQTTLINEDGNMGVAGTINAAGATINGSSNLNGEVYSTGSFQASGHYRILNNAERVFYIDNTSGVRRMTLGVEGSSSTVLWAANGGYMALRPNGWTNTSGQLVVAPNGTVTVNGPMTYTNQIVDGTFSGGSYVKYPNGRLEVSGRFNTYVTVNTAWGSCYQCPMQTYTTPTLPVAFTSVETLHLDVWPTSPTGWTTIGTGGTWTGTQIRFYYYVNRPSPVTYNADYNISYRIVGRWK